MTPAVRQAVIVDEIRRIVEGPHEAAKDILLEHREQLATISERREMVSRSSVACSLEPISGAATASEHGMRKRR